MFPILILKNDNPLGLSKSVAEQNCAIDHGSFDNLEMFLRNMKLYEKFYERQWSYRAL
jgi:hypothetical protein